MSSLYSVETREYLAAPDDSDYTADWLTTAHTLCTDHGIAQGHISERLEALREKLAAPEAEPVAYLAWRDGKPTWDEDCICKDPVYPTWHDDNRASMPVYLHPAPQPTTPADDDLTIAYMDGYHKGKAYARGMELTDEEIMAVSDAIERSDFFDIVF